MAGRKYFGRIDRLALTQADVQRLLHFDPETGTFKWIESPSAKKKPGMPAGYTKENRTRVHLYGASYKAHRLAWLYMTGAWPNGEIDHINGDASDNRWVNLRDVPRAINQQNMRIARADNLVGLLGVSRNYTGWKARVHLNGKCHNIGTFQTPEEAHAAYIKAKRRLHVGCTI